MASLKTGRKKKRQPLCKIQPVAKPFHMACMAPIDENGICQKCGKKFDVDKLRDTVDGITAERSRT